MIKIIIKSNLELEEGRIEDIKKKYPGKEELVDQFSKAPGDNKYLDWMMRHHSETTPENMLAAIQKFHKHANIPEDTELDSKDISSYSNFESLKTNLSDIRPPKRELERTGTRLIYNDDEFSIKRPTNREAACKLGSTTKWCIAATKSRNYFGSYARGGVQHYILKIKNLKSDDPKNLIAYSFIKTDTGKPKLEINDEVNDYIKRKDVVDAIYSAIPERPTSSPSDSNFLNYNLGPGDDDFDFESDYADAKSDENEAKEKEEKLFQIMLADFQKQIPSDPGDPIDEKYDDLQDVINSYDNYDRSERIASKIYEIFYNSEVGDLNSEPRFVKRQIKRLIRMNNEYIDNYLLKTFYDKSLNGKPNRIARGIIANITPEQKSEVLRRVETKKREDLENYQKKVNELVDAINDPRYKPVLDLLNNGYKLDAISRFLKGAFPTYSEEEIEDAVNIVLEKNKKQPEATNESKLFRFNKDNKIFKLAR